MIVLPPGSRMMFKVAEVVVNVPLAGVGGDATAPGAASSATLASAANSMSPFVRLHIALPLSWRRGRTVRLASVPPRLRLIKWTNRAPEQQIQRYEATMYSGVSLVRLQEVADALELEIEERVTYSVPG